MTLTTESIQKNLLEVQGSGKYDLYPGGNQSIEADPELTETIKLTDKDCKSALMNVIKDLGKICM